MVAILIKHNSHGGAWRLKRFASQEGGVKKKELVQPKQPNLILSGLRVCCVSSEV